MKKAGPKIYFGCNFFKKFKTTSVENIPTKQSSRQSVAMLKLILCISESDGSPL